MNNHNEDDEILEKAEEIRRKRMRISYAASLAKERAKEVAEDTRQKNCGQVYSRVSAFLRRHTLVTVEQLDDYDNDQGWTGGKTTVFTGCMEQVQAIGYVADAIPLAIRRSAKRNLENLLDDGFYSESAANELLEHPDPEDVHWHAFMRRLHIVARPEYAKEIAVLSGPNAAAAFIAQFGTRMHCYPSLNLFQPGSMQPYNPRIHHNITRREYKSQAYRCLNAPGARVAQNWACESLREAVRTHDTPTILMLVNCAALLLFTDAIDLDEDIDFFRELLPDCIQADNYSAIGLVTHCLRIVCGHDKTNPMQQQVFGSALGDAVVARRYSCIRVLRAYGAGNYFNCEYRVGTDPDERVVGLQEYLEYHNDPLLWAEFPELR